MLPSGSTLHKEDFDPHAGKQEIESAQSVVNPSHTTTIQALKDKYGLNIDIPKEPVSITLQDGDSILVAEHNLPRLSENRHYSTEEIDNANIRFYKYTLSHRAQVDKH